MLVLLLGLPWVACQSFETSRRLSYVPKAMGVTRVIYKAEQAWGIGLPGDNETGIILYEMPDKVAGALLENGLSYLQSLPPRSGRDGRGQFDKWQQTPIVTDNRQWAPSKNEGRWQWVSPGIGDYLGQYGFSVQFDPAVEKLVNEAIFQPGSFYAYGRIGMIILITSQKRIVFAYAG